MKEPRRSTALRFTHLEVRNWRNFSHIDTDLAMRVLLVGPNASGKSNLLDTFRFLKDLVAVGGGFREAVRRRGGVSSLRCLSARRYSDITLRVVIGNDDSPAEWEYELTFRQDNLRRPIVVKERVLHKGQTVTERPDEQDTQDQERMTQTHLEQVLANQEFREVAEFLSTVRYLHIVPQLVREPDRSTGRSNDPFGGDFLEGMARINTNTRVAWLARIKQALALAVPQLKELELTRDDRGTPHLRGKYEHWRPQGAWQTEERFSDGTLRLLGLLWATLEGGGPLLLEEPELSLHPAVVRYIPQMFARMQRRSGRQILLSTHSADMLQDEGIGLDEVLLLTPDPEGTKVAPASSLIEAVDLLQHGSTLADVVLPHTRPESVAQLALFGD